MCCVLQLLQPIVYIQTVMKTTYNIAFVNLDLITFMAVLHISRVVDLPIHDVLDTSLCPQR